jgi:hypothetical protein
MGSAGAHFDEGHGGVDSFPGEELDDPFADE